MSVIDYMERPNWVFGSEKRFFDFISGLGKEKIVLVSHTDFDGIASAKIVNEVVKADDVFFVGYNDLNQSLVQVLRERKAKKVIFTDLFFRGEGAVLISEIQRFADVLIIDHHTPDVDFNSPKCVMMNAQNFCAAYLSYYLFNRVQDLSYLDWMAAAASITDIAIRYNPEFMIHTMKRYGDKFEIRNGEIRKDGRFWDFTWRASMALVYFRDDLKSVFDSLQKDFFLPTPLADGAKEVQMEYDYILSNNDKFRKTFRDGFLYKINPKFPLTSVLSTDISFRNPNKTIIIIRKEEDMYKFSARRQDGLVDLNEFSKQLVDGFNDSNAGGHRKASGGAFPIGYYAEFERRLGIMS